MTVAVPPPPEVGVQPCTAKTSRSIPSRLPGWIFTACGPLMTMVSLPTV